MRWDVFAWGVAALLLCAAEALAPGAFMLWLGFAAVDVFHGVLLVPGTSLLVQAVAFVVLSVISIQVYRTWFRGRGRASDQPLRIRRVDQRGGRVVPLERGIANGRGRVQIADALWDVVGPELPAGASVRIVGADGMTLRVEAA